MSLHEAYIIDACRTPRGIGKPDKGALAGLHPQRLAACVLSAIAERNGLVTADVDDVIWSTNAQLGKQGADLGRMAALDAGYDIRSSGVTLDRFCGRGITAVAFAAAQIMCCMEDLVIAGGAEMLSYTATLPPESEQLLDRGNRHLRSRHPQSHQGVCADAVAAMEGISRETLEALGFTSQRRAATAIQEGCFNKSLVSVYREGGTLALDRDEFPRPKTTLEALAQLKPSFAAVADLPLDVDGTTYRGLIRKKYPTLNFTAIHHAGTSSGMVDGAAAVLLASPAYAKKASLKPRARIVATANAGDCPTLMLNAPVPAARKVLAKAGLDIRDIDLWEINEAFAVVSEKFQRDLSLDREKVNVNGGAIALGHPIGATGAILIGTLLDELERRDLKRGLITMCIGGGQGIAMIVETLLNF